MYKEYNFYDSNDVNKEVLTKDLSFLEDAATLLEERAGFKDDELDTPEKIYDSYMEHFRISDVNEVTAVKDLRHVMTGTTEQKARYGRLLDLYERSEGESFFEDLDTGARKLGDYAQGLATAPSTIASIFTGGFSKIATQGGVQATKLGIKKILKEVMKAGAKGAAIEGGIGLGQGIVKESTRVASGIKGEKGFEVERPLTETALAATGGFLLTGITRAVTLPSELKTLKLEERASSAIKLREAKAKAKTDEVLKSADKDTISKIDENLIEITKPKKGDVIPDAPLDPKKVAEGKKLKDDISTSETMTSTLSEEVRDNITAAVLRVGKDVVNQKPGERITAAIYRAIVRGDVPIDNINKVLDEHNITLDQFSLIYKADVSEAGRLLGQKGLISRTFGGKSSKKDRQAVKDLLDQVDGLDKAGVSKVSAKETAETLKENPLLLGWRLFQDIDQARISFMTVQPKTAGRNTVNGGFRVMTDAMTRAMDNVIYNTGQLRYGLKGNYRVNPFDGTYDVANFIFNPYEADLIKKVFSESFPNESRRLFFKNADIEARAGGDGILTTIGRKLNFLNTASDNIFKRAVLGASLKRSIKDANIAISAAEKKTIIQQRVAQILGPDYRTSPDYTKTVTAVAKQVNKQKNHTIFTAYESGNFAKIATDDMFTKATKDAYDFAYQTQFKEYGKLGSDAARGLITAVRKIPFVLSSFIPFPKFVASQLKFIYQHAPVIGMIPLEKIPNPLSPIKAKKVRYDFKDRLAKQFTGAALTSAAYAWRVRQGDTNHWYEYKNNEGKLVDGRPLYGPFSMFMLYADLIYRYKRDQLPTKSWGRYAKDVLQAVAGSTFRTGLGLYTLDKLLTDLSNTEGEGSEVKDRIVGEVIGNLVKTVTIPIAPFRDLYAQFDIKSSYVPESRTGETNLFDIIDARGTSNLIDFGEDTPFIGKEGFASIPSLANKLNLEYDKPARSAFQTGPIIAQDPLVSQITTETARPAKNAYQQELGRLNMQNFQIYRRHPNEKVDRLTRFYLSEEGSDTNLNEVMARTIRKDQYKQLSYKEKREAIYVDSIKVIGRARKKALGEIKTVEGSKAGAKYTTIDFQKWQSLNQRTKEAVNELLKRELPKYGFRDFTSVNADKEKMVRIKDKEISVLNLAIKAIPKVRKGIISGTR
tara:strand:+ start:2490 stop:5966 length:3477 start_codon:yes stop_codon:yes gene_type:complete